MHVQNALFIALFTFATAGYSQSDFFVDRLDPPSWRVDSDGDELEILVYGGDFSEIESITTDIDGVEIIDFEIADNPNYIYVTVEVEARNRLNEGHFIFQTIRETTRHSWRVSPLQSTTHGLSASDYIYLITADRFANGDESNDAFATMNEDSIARNEPYARHGGDMQGIIDHLEYIQSLGINALWMSPLLENNEYQASYHGYAITDHYLIDPRYGSMEKYREMVDAIHQRDMKIVKDVVYNHFGDQHYLFLDPPSDDWFNRWPEYTQTNYRATTLMDPYASNFDASRFTDGWFDRHMPDVNQRNPHVARWLIQNSIWWIDEYGIDAFRIDTYAYPDQQFMADLSEAILERHPDFFIFAETWVHHAPTQYWFMGENGNRAFSSNLQSVTDFQLYFAIKEALTGNPDWSSGMAKVYYTLAHDYLYEDPYRLVTFVDNHDEGRYFGMMGEDMRKYKMGIGFMLTTRGIPCLYYGTEILMKETDGHGKMRQDFPGGWSDDSVDKFNSAGRDSLETVAFDFVQHLGNLRRSTPALTTGKLTQWAAKGGLYVYTRSDENTSFIVLMNASTKSSTAFLADYDEILSGHRQFEVHGSTDWETGEVIHLEESIELEPYSIHILERSLEPFE